MYRKDKLYSFHISREELVAIDTIRKKGINTSSFLRRQIRELAERLVNKNKSNDTGGLY